MVKEGIEHLLQVFASAVHPDLVLGNTSVGVTRVLSPLVSAHG